VRATLGCQQVDASVNGDYSELDLNWSNLQKYQFDQDALKLGIHIWIYVIEIYSVKNRD